MFRFAVRLTMALLADALRDRLDPGWRFRLVQRQMLGRISITMTAATVPIQQLTVTMSTVAEIFKRFSDGMVEGDRHLADPR